MPIARAMEETGKPRGESSCRTPHTEHIAFVLLYFAVGRVSLLLSFADSSASPVWPPAGLAFAAVIIAGAGILPWVLAGAVLTNVTTFLSQGEMGWAPVCATALGIAVGNGLEAGAALWVRRALARVHGRFGQAQLGWLCLCGTLGSLVAAAAGATCLTVSGKIPTELFVPVGTTWFVGDLVGILTFTPLILFWWHDQPDHPAPYREASVYGYLGAVLVLALAPGLWWMTLPMLLLPLWALLHWGARAIATSAVLSFALLLWIVGVQLGEVQAADNNRILLLMQVLIGIGQLTLLTCVIRRRRPDFGYGGRNQAESGVQHLLRSMRTSHHGVPLVPAAAAAAGIALTLVAWHGVSRAELEHIRQQGVERGKQLAQAMELRLLTRIEMLEGMASRWVQAGGLDEATWLSQAQAEVRRDPAIQNLSYNLPNGDVHWLEPVEGNQGALRPGLNSEPRRQATLQRAWRSGTTALVGPINLVQGGTGMLVFVPLLVGQRFDGFLTGVIKYHTVLDALDALRLRMPAQDFDVSVKVAEVAVLEQGSVHPRSWTGHSRHALRGTPIHVAVTPKGAALAELRSDMPAFLISAGTLISLLLGWSIFMTQAASRQAQSARASGQAKIDFLATMSHELRTPLNGIIGACNLLRRRLQLSGREQEIFDLLDRTSHSLLDMINDLLDVSKNDAGRLELESLPLDLRRLVDDCLQIVQPVAGQKNLRLESEVDAAVPITVLQDPVRLKQVLLNLLSNAVKFSNEGRVSCRVSVSADQRLDIEVRDTGIGIEEAKIPMIFDPFMQADASITRTHGGTGLGLAICRQIVEAMDGQITCASRPGQGTCVRIDLPLRPSEESPQGPAPPPAVVTPPTKVDKAAAKQSGSPTAAGLRVLVTDDHPANRLLCRSILEHLGCEVSEAGDARAALETCQQQGFDLLLMDLHMPDLDGAAGTELIRQDPALQELPIYALTADDSKESHERCMAAGMQGILRKPIRVEMLAELLAQFGQRT